MEIKQSFPGEFLARQRLVALDDRVVFHHKDLYREMTKEYFYSQLSPSLTRARMPQRGWSELGWWLTIPSVVLALYLLLTGSRSPLAWVAIGGFALPLLIGYALRFKKDDLVAFSYKTGPYAFSVKLSGRPGDPHLEFIELLQRRISGNTPS